MSFNKTELTKLSIADLWAIMEYASQNMTQWQAEVDRLPGDEDAKARHLHYWTKYMAASSEFEGRMQKLSI